MNYTLRRIPQLFLDGLLALRPNDLIKCLFIVLGILRRPSFYVMQRYVLKEPSAMSMLVLSMPLSLLRFTADPNVANTQHLLGLDQVPHFFAIGCFVLGSAIGALVIPMFWHKVLKLDLDHDHFIAAMIVTYVVVELPWDISSLLWMKYVIQGSVPLWLPDTLKTIIVTIYCTLVGRALDRDQVLASRLDAIEE